MSDDVQRIVDVCVRYAYALDGHDWDQLRACFTPDVTGEYAGVGTLHGYDALEDLCRRALEGLTTQHLLGNHLVEVDGDEARSTCYFHAQHVRADAEGGPNYTVAGRYADRLVRSDGGWKIAERVQTVSWTAGNPAVLTL